MTGGGREARREGGGCSGIILGSCQLAGARPTRRPLAAINANGGASNNSRIASFFLSIFSSLQTETITYIFLKQTNSRSPHFWIRVNVDFPSSECLFNGD